MRALPRIGLIVAAVLVIGGVVWLSNRSRPVHTPNTEIEVEDTANAPTEPNIIAGTPPMREPTPPAPNLNPAPNLDPSPAPPPTSPEMKIDEILLAENLDETTKANRLLGMLPSVPESLQEETAQHICNLMPDEAYGALGPLLTNGVAPEAVLDIVMADLVSRPNALKLPLLLQMARAEQHPRSEEARSVLELHLEKDFGTDWAAWENSLQAWLKENPD